MALPDLFSSAISRASAAVDRQVLGMMERRMRAGAPRPPADARRRLIELAATYGTPATLATPSAFFPAPPAAELAETAVSARGEARVVDLAFPSSYRAFWTGYTAELARWPDNLTAHARLYRVPSATPRPVLICLHGWGGGAYWLEERAFVVDYWLRRGLDVALFQLPFHGNRAGRPDAGQRASFPSANLPRTNEAFGQAIHDLRALAAALRARGAPAIGVMGMSLGGYTTALWAGVDPTLAFAFPIIPAVSMSDLMWRHGESSPARRRAEKAGVDGALITDVFAVHAPLGRAALLPRERLLIVAGRGDRITPPDQAESLARHWGCELHWFPGGHLAQIGRGDAFRTIRRRLETIGVIAAQKIV